VEVKQKRVVDLYVKNYKSYFLYARKYLARGMAAFLVLTLFSCGKKPVSASAYLSFKSPDGKPDYSKPEYWAAHPVKLDPADSIPAPLKDYPAGDSGVDVFFLYPTSFTSGSDTGWNAAIDDEAINQKTDYSSILYQASAFNQYCRVFAPRYRQAHIRCFFIPDSVSAPYFNLAYADIKAAFEEYLRSHNAGRPIIIAAHSQGTLHAGRLIREFFDGTKLQEQLVCAYLVGMPVPESYFRNIRPCPDSTSTGCFVSWRTFKSGYEGNDIIKAERVKMTVTNPLSWTRDEVFVPAAFNKGGILRSFNKLIPHVVSAQVHQNILWTSKPDMPGKFLLTTKNYHIGDINLFYLNIRENVATRIRSYKKNMINK